MDTEIGTHELVGEITATWRQIQLRHPELPAVMFTLGEGGGPDGRQRLGHFLAGGWVRRGSEDRVHEVFVGAEGLAAGAEELLDTLLHEAAHALAHVRGVQDTSRQGRYHNARFRDVAREIGLVCTQSAGDGWAQTQLDDTTRARYTRQVTRLDKAIGGHRVTRMRRRRRASSNNGTALVCDCGRKVRVAPSIAALGPILCGVCDAAFVEVAPPDEAAGSGA